MGIVAPHAVQLKHVDWKQITGIIHNTDGTTVYVFIADGSKSDSDDDSGPVFSTYSSSSVFDKLSTTKKGRDWLRPPEGALTAELI